MNASALFARCRGFSLIEMLVTLVVLAIGLVGAAGLQASGAMFSHDAYLRSQITLAMYDFVDRVRLNKANAGSYVTARPLSLSGTAPDCDPTTAANASTDIACWRHHLIRGKVLPPGTTASVANPTSNEYTITVTWTDRESTVHNISYRFQP